jgi:hypothetical protein
MDLSKKEIRHQRSKDFFWAKELKSLPEKRK